MTATDLAPLVTRTTRDDSVGGSCEPCGHAAQHAWWGPSLSPFRSHCRGCHLSWKSLREAHCTRCHAHFVSPEIADFHRTDEGCLAPEDVFRRDGRPRYVVRRWLNGVPVWALAFYGQRPGFWGRDADSDDDGGQDDES